MDKRLMMATLLFFIAAFGFAQGNGYRSVVITPPNAVIQPGESVTLTASGATFYQWSPAAGLSNTTGPVTVASPSVTTIYTCTGYCQGSELVVNGDFEQGNTGFTSAYQYIYNLGGSGTYNVDSTTLNHHPNFFGNGHGGSGNFMIINGAHTLNTNVWSETIAVQPNTDYAFSTYVCTVCTGAEARLQFSINGQQIGGIFTAPNSLYTWLQFYQIWNSGNSTSATITILNQNTTQVGNDFGLDDISFCELNSESEAYCTVSLGEMAAGNDNVSTCCENAVIVDFLDNDYVLENCNNLSCSIIQQPAHGSATYANGVMLYTPDDGYAGSDSFRYRITCNGQSAEATVSITVLPRPQRTINQHACESFTWAGYSGQTYTDSGTWQYIKPNSSGCDSLIILNLTIHHSTEETLPPVVECDEYTWHGVTYTISGLYDYSATNEWGCSFQHLPLTIHHSDTVETSVSACEEYTWHGVTYNASGDKTYMTTNEHGCNRLEILHLTISDAYLIQGESQVYAASDLISGLYRYHIDSNDILSFQSWGLSNPDWRIVETYENGCLLFVGAPGTAELTVSFNTLSCGETTRTMWINAVYFGVSENRVEVKVFPNPTSDHLTVEAEEIEEIKVVGILGQILMTENYGKENNVSLNLSELKPALYLLEIKTAKGKTVKLVSVNR